MTLERAIAAARRADASGLADALIALPEKERRSLFDELQHLIRPHIGRGPLRDLDYHWVTTGQVAAFGTGTSREIDRTGVWMRWAKPHRRVAAVVAARPKNMTSAIVRSILSNNWTANWFVVRDLVRSGHIEHPDNEQYYLRLVQSLPRVFEEVRPDADMVVQVAISRMRADTALADELFRAMEFEEVVNWMSLSWSPWSHLLVALVDAALMDRAVALDAAMAGQLRDLRPTSTAFFRKVSLALDPSSDELAERSSLLIRAVAIAPPSEQRVAADRLRMLVKSGVELDGQAVASAVATPLTGSQKGAAIAALRLLEVVRLDDLTRGQAVLCALGHPHSDVQARTLRILTRLGDDTKEALRADVLPWTDSVAPEHTEAVQAFVGVTIPKPKVPTLDLGTVEMRVAALPLELDRALAISESLEQARSGSMPSPARFDPAAVPPASHMIEPITDAASLVETLTVVIAGTGDATDVERAIDGLARVDLRRADKRTRSPLQPLVERFHSPNWTIWSAAHAFELAAWQWLARKTPPSLPYLSSSRRFRMRRSTMATLMKPPPATEKWIATAFDGSPHVAGTLGFLAARVHEAVTIGLASPRPTLALPTTTDGWLASEQLAARIDELGRRRATPGRFEAVQALLRLRSGATEVAKRVTEMAGSATDAGLIRAGENDLQPRPVGLDIVDEPAGREGDRPITTIRYLLTEPPPKRRRDDPVGLIAAELGANQRSPIERGWWSPFHSAIPTADKTGMHAVLAGLPNHLELVEAHAATMIALDMDSNRSSDALDLVVSAAADRDAPLTMATHVLLAVALGAKNQTVATAGTDLLIAASEDGRLDPEQLGSFAAELTDRGLLKPSRLALRMGEAIVSPLASDRVRVALSTWIAKVGKLPRDAHAVLAVLERACAATERGVTDSVAREKLRAATGGSSKRAKAATRLLALNPGQADQLALAAVERLLARAEHWANHTD